MEWIEVFVRDEKDFVYIDFSGLTKDKSYIDRIEQAMPIIEAYEENSLRIVANAESVRFDSNTKRITADFINRLKPYAIASAVLGADGTKKLMIAAAMKMAGHMNIYFAYSKEEAIEWLLEQE